MACADCMSLGVHDVPYITFQPQLFLDDIRLAFFHAKGRLWTVCLIITVTQECRATF
jgi:hypothetical protein